MSDFEDPHTDHLVEDEMTNLYRNQQVVQRNPSRDVGSDTPKEQAIKEGDLRILQSQSLSLTDTRLLRFNNSAKTSNLQGLEANWYEGRELNALRLACMHESLDIIGRLMEHPPGWKPTPNVSYYHRFMSKLEESPFYTACKNGKVNVVRALLESDYPDIYGGPIGTPLGVACIEGHVNVVQVLVSSPRVELNDWWLNDAQSYFSLERACHFSHIRVVEWILGSGRPVSTKKGNVHCTDACTSDDVKNLIDKFEANRNETIKDLRKNDWFSESEPSPAIVEDVIQCHALPLYTRKRLEVKGGDTYSLRYYPTKMSDDELKKRQPSGYIEYCQSSAERYYLGIDILSPTDLPYLPSFPPKSLLRPTLRFKRLVWSKGLQVSDSYLYLGHTIDDFMILKSTSTDPKRLLTKWNHLFFENPPVIERRGEDNFPENFDASTFITKLVATLRSRTVMEQPIMKLLDFTHAQPGTRVPVAIVGGAIRALLRPEEEISDIDFAIGSTWNELSRHIHDFFATQNRGLNRQMFFQDGIRKQFGMMKLNGTEGDRKSDSKRSDFDLDFGLFKAGRNKPSVTDLQVWPDAQRLKKEVENEFFYAFSFDFDAEYRDYTVNAVYFDVFKQEFVDPTGYGLQDILSTPIIARVATRSQQILLDDLGGRFRLWKMFKKGYQPEPLIMPVWICRQLFREALKFNSCIEKFERGQVCSTQEVEDGEYWIGKFMKKLFKADDPSLTKSQETAAKLKALVDQYAIQPCMIDWWNETVALCRHITQKKGPFFPGLQAHQPEDVQIWFMCCAVSASDVLPTRPFTIFVEDAIDHFLCQKRRCSTCGRA